MSETPTKATQLRSLLPILLGFVVALACTMWAARQFATSGSSIGYGALTGLSFGALFAFGQQIRERFLGPARARRRRLTPVATATLRPAQRAAAKKTIPLTVTMDDKMIRTVRGSVERDSIAWQDIERIVIVISEDLPPLPQWRLIKAAGEMHIANDTPGLDQLMEQFKVQLAGYDNDATYEAVIEAMGALQGSFEIWRKAVTPTAS